MHFRRQWPLSGQWPLVLIAFVVTGLMVGIRQLGLSQPLELAIYDWMLRSQPVLPPDPRILIVGITEEDIQTQQNWPLADEVIAALLTQLQQHNPTAIGLDIYRDIPHLPGTQSLKKALQAENVISIENLGNLDTESVPAPPGIPKHQIGFNDLVIDSDGVIRRQFMFAALGTERFYSLSLQLSLLYLAKKDPNFSPEPTFTAGAMQLGNTRFYRLKNSSGGYQVIDNAGYQSLLKYRLPTQPARIVSLSDVLQNQIDPHWVNGKIVLIGTTALSQHDYFYTPYGSSESRKLVVPGVVIHAHMTSQILSAVTGEQALFQFWPDYIEVTWIALWAFVGSFLIYRLNRLNILSLASLGCILIISGVAVLTLTQNIWVPCAVPLLGFMLAGVITLAYKEFYRSFFDELTGLSNRRFFIQTLKKSLQQDSHKDNNNVAILFIDIDRFTLINDNFGRAAGDELLRILTYRLQSNLPPKSKLAKLDGDDFVVLLKQCFDSQTATKLADQLQSSIAEPIFFKQQQLNLTASIGVALSETGSHKQPEAIVRDAQIAMYRAKSMGKARYEVFSKQMRAQSAIRFSLQSDLHQAIEHGQLRLYYQPLVCLKTGLIQGFEALVRWQHPQKGLIYPSDFISLAEESGLIVPLGYWVLREACRQTFEWCQTFPHMESLFISVNLSGCQFTDVHLIENIQRILEETGLNPCKLKLELTESVVMDDVEISIQGLLQLKALNVKLGIDDFGTGYSSLSYLHRFPVDTLKVDQSFVMRMHDASENEAIVKTIIALSHNLNMNVVAEGIEIASQANKLRAWGCEYGQGYFFSKPTPPDEATTLLTNPPNWKY
ncbi:MAG: EAL domain-containing protein [Leptolyngbya sp. SIO3F4]|nr:EAL domain-containing protein [Leptolyngbya sp. SIO3F4]